MEKSRRSLLKVMGAGVGRIMINSVIPKNILDSPTLLRIQESEAPWHIQDINEIRKLLTSSEFLQNNILVGDGNPAQYDSTIPDNFRTNSCGLAVVSMVERTMGYLKDGVTDPTTIGERIKFLTKPKVTTDGRKYLLLENNGTMTPSALEKALTVFDQNQELIITKMGTNLPFRDPLGGARYSDFSRMNDLIDFSNGIFNKGGELVIGGLKYGKNGPGTIGHFVVVTGLRSEKVDRNNSLVLATIVDPHKEGKVWVDVSWRDYWENYHGVNGLVITPLICILGVSPKWTNRNHYSSLNPR